MTLLQKKNNKSLKKINGVWKIFKVVDFYMDLKLNLNKYFYIKTFIESNTKLKNFKYLLFLFILFQFKSFVTILFFFILILFNKLYLIHLNNNYF